MKIGIIREGKTPPDARTPLTPHQCAEINGTGDHVVVVQSSAIRCYSDSEYQMEGVDVVDDVTDCDILLGVKEVPVDMLIPDKTYFFFSHTIKQQPYNRDLLKAILKHNITLIDYEVLTNDRGARVIAFGKFAGMVGAHNALWTYGQRKGTLILPRMYECKDYKEVLQFYDNTPFPPVRVVLTGTGRVANGAAKVLLDMGFSRVTPDQFKAGEGPDQTFTQLAVTDYATHKDNRKFTEQEYFDHPQDFIIDFSPYAIQADVMINGIYWDPKAPAFFTVDQMRSDDFNIQVIGDVTCDIAPESSIPSTLRAAKIKDPVFGFDPHSGKEVDAFLEGAVDMMTIDNLPNELSRDASDAFGEQFIEHILPELSIDNSPILRRGTIAQNGQLGQDFAYLQEYAFGD